MLPLQSREKEAAMMTNSWKDLDDAPAHRQKGGEGRYPCPRCAGSGKYRGPRVHQPETRCFACNGRGYFKTSEKDRREARAKRQQRKVQKTEENLERFKHQHPEMAEFLLGVREWNDFARSLLDSVQKYGELTEKQHDSAMRMKHKVEAKRREREQNRTQPAVKIELGQLLEKFETARASGLKFPKMRVAGFVINRAGDDSRNPGYLYVKRDGTYIGKVSPKGEFFRGRDCTDEDVEALREIEGDVYEAAVRYGRETGKCSCCGRVLTDPASIEAGIGPICAGNWGM